MRSNQYLDRLKKVPLFQAFSQKELGHLARLAEDVDIPAGRSIVKEGATGREFFVIMRGKASVYRGKRKIASLGPGHFFGELSLLDGAPRNATITAETDMEVVVLGQREFLGLLGEIPALSLKVMKGIAGRLRDCDSKSIG